MKFCKRRKQNEFIRVACVTTISLQQAWFPISNNVAYAERWDFSVWTHFKFAYAGESGLNHQLRMLSFICNR